jgi:putative transposase
MGHSYSNVLLHIVFSTKNRRKIIPPDHQEQHITGIVHNLHGSVLAIGGMPDHTHILLAQPGTIGFSTMVQKIKTNSSGWMEETVKDFEWQEGFGAFSVSDSRRADVIAYIRNQEEHHKSATSKRNLLRY